MADFEWRDGPVTAAARAEMERQIAEALDKERAFREFSKNHPPTEDERVAVLVAQAREDDSQTHREVTVPPGIILSEGMGCYRWVPAERAVEELLMLVERLERQLKDVRNERFALQMELKRRRE